MPSFANIPPISLGIKITKAVNNKCLITDSAKKIKDASTVGKVICIVAVAILLVGLIISSKVLSGLLLFSISFITSLIVFSVVLAPFLVLSGLIILSIPSLIFGIIVIRAIHNLVSSQKAT